MWRTVFGLYLIANPTGWIECLGVKLCLKSVFDFKLDCINNVPNPTWGRKRKEEE